MMAKYATSNSKLNSEKLWVIGIILCCSLIYIFSNQEDLFAIFIVIIVNILMGAVLYSWYRTNEFVLSFNENDIEQLFTYSGEKYCFKYQDLKQIHYRSASGSTASNTLLFLQKDGALYEVKVNTVGYNETYVSFIKWLKTKNSDFETHVYPKGSVLHLRLRQELLGSEY